MVQNLSTTAISPQLLAKTLGVTLSEAEYDRILKQLEICQPPSGKQLWQSTDAKPGIYIVIDSKVRLLDR